MMTIMKAFGHKFALKSGFACTPITSKHRDTLQFQSSFLPDCTPPFYNKKVNCGTGKPNTCLPNIIYLIINNVDDSLVPLLFFFIIFFNITNYLTMTFTKNKHEAKILFFFVRIGYPILYYMQ